MGWNSLPGIPPAHVSTAPQFVELLDLYADGRGYFDDDPPATLERLGLTEADFSVDAPWDRYPIVGDLLEIWDATSRYVETYVDHAYPTDSAVAGGQELARWIGVSGRADDGNVRGLPPMDSRDALKRVLHSLVYRIVARGGSRLYRSGNPGADLRRQLPALPAGRPIPEPRADFDTRVLLRYLPNTGSIGSMAYLYFNFWATPPYVPFVPITGAEPDLSVDDDVSNQALIELRRFIAGFFERVEPDTPQIWQWERNVEL